MTQCDLATAAVVSYSMVRAIERGARYPSSHVLDALAAVLGVDPSRLLGVRDGSDSRVHALIPDLSKAIAAYDGPDDGPVRSLPELHGAVAEAVSWRLAAQYLRIVRQLPGLLSELCRALHTTPSDREHAEVAALLTAAFRAADAVAYKCGARDLSARLVELMRWAAEQADDPLQTAAANYVRGETFFAASAYSAGLRALEAAINTAPAADTRSTTAACGALHMRAAVMAGRARDAGAATEHMDEARRLGDTMPEGVYTGTCFGPSSVRIHEVSVSVGLGEGHLDRALTYRARVGTPAASAC